MVSIPKMFAPVPLPPQPNFIEGIAEIPGTKLYYRDYGGNGVPVVLLHPFTGSSLNWSYQVPAFVNAGYRVIAYSRRGYRGSEPVIDPSIPWQPSTDLGNLMDKLGVGKFCAVAADAGCSVALDFAMGNLDRLHAVVASAPTFTHLEESEYRSLLASLRAGLDTLSPEVRTLGPAYRAANRDGVKQWLALESTAVIGEHLGFKNVNPCNWATLGKISTPTMFIAGGADLNAPPTLMRLVVEHLPNAEMALAPNCGHSIYWENPEFFNNAVLTFLGRHAKK